MKRIADFQDQETDSEMRELQKKVRLDQDFGTDDSESDEDWETHEQDDPLPPEPQPTPETTQPIQITLPSLEKKYS